LERQLTRNFSESIEAETKLSLLVRIEEEYHDNQGTPLATIWGCGRVQKKSGSEELRDAVTRYRVLDWKHLKLSESSLGI